MARRVVCNLFPFEYIWCFRSAWFLRRLIPVWYLVIWSWACLWCWQHHEACATFVYLLVFSRRKFWWLTDPMLMIHLPIWMLWSWCLIKLVCKSTHVVRPGCDMLIRPNEAQTCLADTRSGDTIVVMPTLMATLRGKWNTWPTCFYFLRKLTFSSIPRAFRRKRGRAFPLSPSPEKSP